MGWAEKLAALQGTAVRTFTEPVIYEPAAGGSSSIEGIYREAFVGVDLGQQQQVASEQPQLDVLISDLGGSFDADDRFVIRGLRYLAHDHQEDGEGMVKFFLGEDVDNP